MSLINNFRKALVVMLVAATVIAFMPVLSGSGSADAADQYFLWVGGVEVTPANKDDIDGTGSASYDPESRTLTLNDYTYTGPGVRVISSDDYRPYRAAIVSFGELNIEVKGSANINLTDKTGAGEYVAAGIATLSHSGGQGDLSIERGKISVSATSSVKEVYLYGIYTQGGFAASSCTVNAKASNKTLVKESIGLGIGVDCDPGMLSQISFDTYKATVNATGGYAVDGNKANALSMGIRCFPDAYIDNMSTVTAKAGNGGTTLGMEVNSMFGSSLYIGSGSLTATAPKAAANYGESIGISNDSIMLTADNAKVKAVGYTRALSSAPELDGANLYVKYSANVDGTQPTGSGVYYAGKYYDSSAVKEEIMNGTHYFETSEVDFKDLANCRVEKIPAVPYAGGYPVRPSEVRVWDGDKLLVEGQDYYLSFHNNKDVGVGIAIITGNLYTGQLEIGFDIVDFGSDIDRIAGNSRYETSLLSADKLLEIRGADEFDNIIVACGSNFPDALAGSYLAKEKKAPIILVDKSVEDKVISYIESKFSGTGKIYILGGTGAVSKSFADKLKAKGISVKRLDGVNRYQTNIKILKAAGVDSEELLICTGTGYADSLSASAAGRPILLVGTSLNAEQKQYLQTISPKKLYVVGGTGAVNDSVVKEVEKSTGGLKAMRLAGSTRYETSILVAKTFVDKSKRIVLAYAKNFPDGLSGGPIALELGAPLILATNDNIYHVRDYTSGNPLRKVYVLGGEKLISVETISKIMPVG